VRAAGPGGAPRPVAPTPRAQLARAALEKRARTRLSAAVVLFVFHHQIASSNPNFAARAPYDLLAHAQLQKVALAGALGPR
jgi:hypothetical protein